MNLNLITFLKNLKAQGERENIPNISLQTAEILQFFVSIARARDILEIGCANGFSTIFLAESMQANGRVVACDVSAPSFAKAQENVRLSGYSAVVDFRFGDALKIVRAAEQFDFVFIDAEKKRTHEFFFLAKKHLRPKGIIFIDDTGKFSEKMKDFLSLRTQEKDFRFFDIPVDGDDTVTVAFRVL